MGVEVRAERSIRTFQYAIGTLKQHQRWIRIWYVCSVRHFFCLLLSHWRFSRKCYWEYKTFLLCVCVYARVCMRVCVCVFELELCLRWSSAVYWLDVCLHIFIQQSAADVLNKSERSIFGYDFIRHPSVSCCCFQLFALCRDKHLLLCCIIGYSCVY